jgi:hypothetical protein
MVDVFERITFWPLKKLLLNMGNIIPKNYRQRRFKKIEFSQISVLHQQLLLKNGFELDALNKIQSSNLITIKDTCNLFFFYLL